MLSWNPNSQKKLRADLGRTLWIKFNTQFFLCTEYGDSPSERSSHIQHWCHHGPNERPFLSSFADEKIIGPRDLHVSEHSHSSLRFTWMPATGRVIGYRVHVHPLLPSGQPVLEDQQQVELHSHLVELQLHSHLVKTQLPSQC